MGEEVVIDRRFRGPPASANGGYTCGRLLRRLMWGRPHIVVGWPGERDGRKHGAGTAIFDAGGTVAAYADALWIELREES